MDYQQQEKRHIDDNLHIAHGFNSSYSFPTLHNALPIRYIRITSLRNVVEHSLVESKTLLYNKLNILFHDKLQLCLDNVLNWL